MSDSILANNRPAIPTNLLPLFSKPPLLKGESLELYLALFDALVADLKPDGALDYLRVQDVAHRAWEILRLRKFQSAFVEACRQECVEREARNALRRELNDEDSPIRIHLDAKPDDRPRQFTPDFMFWALKDPVVQRRQRQLTKSRDSEIDTAKAFLDSYEMHEKLEKIVTATEKGLNNTVRELEFRRELQLQRHEAQLQQQGRPTKWIDADQQVLIAGKSDDGATGIDASGDALGMRSMPVMGADAVDVEACAVSVVPDGLPVSTEAGSEMPAVSDIAPGEAGTSIVAEQTPASNDTETVIEPARLAEPQEREPEERP